MFEFIWQRLEAGTRLALPFLIAFLFTILSVITWPLPHMSAVAPPLGLIAVYYWSIHRPDLFSPAMAFVIGFLNDVVNDLPLGLTALLYVVLHQLVYSQRRFLAGHTFFMLWFGFMVSAFLTMLAEWALLMIIRWQGIPFFPAFMQFVIVVLLFPLPCWLLIRLQRAAYAG